MNFSFKLIFQELPRPKNLYLLFLVFFSCPKLWAAQDALVTAKKALIYSDMEMTSPIGFVSQGKKIKVGDIPRNKAQVYPVIVSGKIAYIRVTDVTTEKESVDSSRLVAERFRKKTVVVQKSKFVASYFLFNSQATMNKENAEILDKSSLLWNGLALRGEVLMKDSWDIQILMNYMIATKGTEKFKVLELGAGVAYRFIDQKKFILRGELQGLAIPFSTYEIAEDFLVRSYGFTWGAGLNGTYFLSQHWGIEGYGGIYQTHLLKFKSPEPYESISPSFLGARLGIGLNYSY